MFPLLLPAHGSIAPHGACAALDLAHATKRLHVIVVPPVCEVRTSEMFKKKLKLLLCAGESLREQKNSCWRLEGDR